MDWNIREILHQFAVTYRIESRETRNEDITKVCFELEEWLKEKAKEYNGYEASYAINKLVEEIKP